MNPVALKNQVLPSVRAVDSPPVRVSDSSAVKMLAAIDIGSNSIRMVIAQVLPDGRIEVVERLHRAVHLGQDTFRTGGIKAPTIRAAVLILRDFQNVLKTYNVSLLKVVATSAVREAANRDTFLDQILMATGLEIVVINSSEESRLMVAAVRHAVGKTHLAKRNSLVVEVGGGSTVLNLLRKGQITVSRNLAMGSIRLQEVLSTSTESTDRAAEMIRHQVAGIMSTMQGLLPLKQVKTIYAIGGDLRWAADRVGKPTNIENLRRVSARDLDKLIDASRHLTVDKLAKKYGLSFSDAETLIPALLIFQVLLHSTVANEILVCNVSMRDGLLFDLAQVAIGAKEESTYDDVIRSTLSMAKKYHVDLKHALHTRDLSIQFFDELFGEHSLDKQYRLVLEVAALLHEIGTFVSSRSHHKHSFYLIMSSEIAGLTQEQLQLVAHVARYHRRSRPKSTHVEYMALPRESRMAVNKLAAILRVADALDASRIQHVKDIEFKLGDEGLIIAVPTTADLSLEEHTLAMKGDLFEDIYGLQIRLERS
jgi:exopolyphosphatase/guanosine-5'-triphosphate,3'-diphosphate pyrophosphatase